MVGSRSILSYTCDWAIIFHRVVIVIFENGYINVLFESIEATFESLDQNCLTEKDFSVDFMESASKLLT